MKNLNSFHHYLDKPCQDNLPPPHPQPQKRKNEERPHNLGYSCCVGCSCQYFTDVKADKWRVQSPVKFPSLLITPMRPQCPNDRDVGCFDANTVRNNFIWSLSAQWVWSWSVINIAGSVIILGCPWYIHLSGMAKWPWCCASTGQYDSN